MQSDEQFHPTQEENDPLPRPRVNGATHAAHVTPINQPPADGVFDYVGRAKAKKVKDKKSGTRAVETQTTIPVRTPDKLWWFRAHPDPTQSFPIDILELKDCVDEGIYFIDPNLEFPDELDKYVLPAILTRCVTSDGTEFFYLAKQSARSPKDSTRRCIREAKYRWIKQHWDATSKGYKYVQANQLRREPTWSNSSMNELLGKAFDEKYITDLDHPVMKKLLTPEDDGSGDVDSDVNDVDGAE